MVFEDYICIDFSDEEYFGDIQAKIKATRKYILYTKNTRILSSVEKVIWNSFFSGGIFLRDPCRTKQNLIDYFCIVKSYNQYENWHYFILI